MHSTALLFLLALPEITFAAKARPVQCRPPVINNPIVIPTSITLDRVRACTSASWWSCNSELVRPEYAGLDNAVSEAKAKELYLSQVITPPKSATRNVVLFLTGQNFRTKGEQSGLTGQLNGYKFNSKATGSGTYHFPSNGSLAKALADDTDLFSADDTFVGMVFDTQFDYELSKQTKDDLLHAYYQYVLAKLGNRRDVGTIYLAGHSRGGCLAMRLAQKLTATLPQARVVIHTFDPVCAKDDTLFSGELGVETQPSIDNPLVSDSKYYVWTTDLVNQFSSTQQQCLDIRSHISGGPVLKFVNQVHAFGQIGIEGTHGVLQGVGRAWYNQTFVTQTHVDVENSQTNWDLDHLKNSMTNLPCHCGSALPPAPTRAPATSPPIPKGYDPPSVTPPSPVYVPTPTAPVPTPTTKLPPIVRTRAR